MISSYFKCFAKGEIYLVASLAFVGLLHPLLYWSIFSGDAEIHLVYANNLLRGHPLEFNVNQANSGETSMGFMLIDTLIMWAFGAHLTPLIIKMICLFGLYLTAFITWLVARQMGVGRPWREIAALLTLWLPGSVYNAMSGTENVIFAAFSSLFIYETILHHWYDEKHGPTLPQDAVAGLMAGALFWLRPETLPLVFIIVAARLIGAYWFQRPKIREALQIGVFGLVFLLGILAYIAIFTYYSHELPYGAGQARRIMSSYLESIWIGAVPVNAKVLVRIFAYFSVVAPALVVAGLAIFHSSSDRSARLRILTIAAVFFGFLAAYLFNLLPSVHFARYTIFVWPYGLILAALGLQMVSQSHWLSRHATRGMVAALAVSLVGVMAYEFNLRSDVWRNSETLFAAQTAPARREATSVNLAKSLGLPVGAPVTLGFQEVDVRYELTDNFEVRSLDGITDSRLLRYLCDGWVDHDGYLIDTKVDYLMEFPTLNRSRSVWSLSDLSDLSIGQSVVRPGIIYTKIQPKIVKINRTVASSSARPGGACSANAQATELTSDGVTASTRRAPVTPF